MSDIDKQVSESVNQYGEIVATIYNERLSAVESATKRRRGTEDEEAGELVENDNIQLEHSELSPGTIIKRYALLKRESYHSLDTADKCRVSLGLNSIIDLGERSLKRSQNTLFHLRDWIKLRENFPKVYEDTDAIRDISKNVEDIEKFVTRDTGQAKYHAAECEYKAQNPYNGDVFDMYHHAINVLQYHSYLFSYDHPEMTEADWMNKIWRELMKTLFRNTPEAGKIHSDRMEVLLESKLVLDDCLSRFFDDSLAIPGLYFTKLNIELVSLRLVANGLYIGITEGKATFPRNASSFKQFRNVANLLMKFKIATQAVASFRQNYTDYETNPSSHPHCRGSWEPPKSDKRACVPEAPTNFTAGGD